MENKVNNSRFDHLENILGKAMSVFLDKSRQRNAFCDTNAFYIGREKVSSLDKLRKELEETSVWKGKE